MRKIKRYKVNKDDSLMLAVSFVKNPAIESKFLALEEEKDKNKYVALKDDYRHVVYGAVLRPDFYIYRHDGDDEYYLQFDKEAIEVLAEKFMTQGRTQNFTEAHKKEVDDISVIEVWTKADMLHDKSIALGLDPSLEVGTLFFGAKVYNDDIWKKVLDGTYEGFSVEAIVNVDELNFESQETVTETVVETPTVEEVVETPKVDEPTVEEPKEKGILAKIMELINGKPVEDVVETPKVEEPKAEEPKAEEPIKEEPKVDIDALTNTIDNLKSELEALKQKNQLLESEKNALSNKVDELGKKPSAEPIKTNGKGGGNDTASNLSNWLDKMQEMMG